MVLEAARLAANRLFSPALRSILWKSLGLTLLALIALWFGVREVFDWLALPWLSAALPEMPDWAGWLGAVVAVIAGVGLALALALLVAPVTAGIAGLFTDDVADVVESEDYPGDAPGKALSQATALWLALKFFVVVIIGNLIAFLLMLIPGINIVAFLIVNAYLLGREYFEFAAMRHVDERTAKTLRRKHSTTVFLGGFVIAGFLAVPILNLATPLFASAMMVHLYKLIGETEV